MPRPPLSKIPRTREVLPHRIAHNAILVDDKSNSRKRTPPPKNPYHSAGLNNDDNRPRILGWRRVRGRRVWGVRHPSSDGRPICVIFLLCRSFLLFFFLPSNFAAAAFRAMSAESKSSFSTAATWERLRLICMMARPSVDDDAMEDDAEDVDAAEEVAVDNIRANQWNGNESRWPIMDGELTSRWPAAMDCRHHGHDRTLAFGRNSVGIPPHVDLGNDRFFDRPL